MDTTKALFDFAYTKISSFQDAILWEAFDKKNGGLALPMGSGKTFISLLLGLLLRINGPVENSPILVVAAKNIIPEWVNEINKFFDDKLKYIIFHHEHIKINETKISDENPIVVLVTPEIISKYYKEFIINEKLIRLELPIAFGPTIKHYNKPSEPFCESMVGGAQLFSIKWSTLIIDEAQTYYNINSARCLGMASICAHNRWLLSGTMFSEPRDHKILGYYLLLNYDDIPRNLPEITKLIRSSKYKGVKETLVIRDKNEDYEVVSKVNNIIISHTLTKEEGKIYISIKQLINNIKIKLDEYKALDDTENVKRLSSYMLGMISYLRQGLVCPLIAITSVAINVADFKCKSQLCKDFNDNINNLGIKEWLDNEDSLYSSRLKEAVSIINKHNNEQIVVFSSYRTVLDVMNYFIPKERNRIVILPSDSIDIRSKKRKSFKSSKNDVLLLTYALGANGLNLQTASTVLILDFWFNADTTSQAIARLLRRGQNAKELYIYYFTANTGIENSLFRIQQSKLKVAKELYNGPITSKICKFTSAEIVKMVNMDDNVNILNNITNN